MAAPELNKIIAAIDYKGHALFTNNEKKYNLNIVGLRSADPTPNIFNDWMYVFWRVANAWDGYHMKITTDPGTYWMEHYENPKGVAILKPGQWRGMWAVGKHQGKYEALVQVKPVTVIRDSNRDKKLDYSSGVEDTGLFGINNHRARLDGESSVVDKWSAGCQVVANSKDYLHHIEICKLAADIHGNSFTYTLLTEKDIL